MKIKLYRENGALGSEPIFNAIEQGFKRLGHSIVQENEDIPVIWSVLWFGRMQNNQYVYQQAKKNQKPVMIVEVGALKRGQSWKLSLDNINNQGIFNNTQDLQDNRSEKLGICLNQVKEKRKDSILLLGQHDKSLQWHGQLPIREWCQQKVSEIRKYSSRPIIIRPHPRCHIAPFDGKNLIFEKARPIHGTYSEFDVDFNHHCVINHNSGTTVQAAIWGAPVICDSSGLAYPIANRLDQLESLEFKNRDQWFQEILHTEWLVDEIESGHAIKRLISAI